MSSDSDSKTQDGKLTLRRPGTLELTKTVDAGQVRQSFSHGRTKSVAVERKQKRSVRREDERSGDGRYGVEAPQGLSETERRRRLEALQGAAREEERMRLEREESDRRAREAAERRAKEEEERQRLEEEARKRAEEDAARLAQMEAQAAAAAVAAAEPSTPPAQPSQSTTAPASPVVEKESARPKTDAKPVKAKVGEEEEDEVSAARKREEAKAKVPARPRTEADRRGRGKLTISQALDAESSEWRGRSLAALQRRREKERQKQLRSGDGEKVLREVILPETITVADLANRMAERAAVVIKALMKMGVIAAANQSIDADTAQLVVEELGHKVKRVSEADVEDVLVADEEDAANLIARPPVVTVMGHVDHGKTSLLDALRSTDVAAGEAGGITQHIGAYQVNLSSGEKITFLDTPGHEAFTAMRQRGAKVTDIVVLVVAADDGIQPQTIEAIHHAKAAKVPMIVAINKIDKPGVDPSRIMARLLEHEVQVEAMGGDTLAIEVSALKRLNLEKLEEAILLQSEVLDLRANPASRARGAIVEAKLEKGRGSVATVLVQSGTLRVGDVFVAGSEWGRVRALIDDRGRQVEEAGPSMPVEILGLQGTPQAGDEFVVLEDENKVREIVDYRQRKARELSQARAARGTLEQMFDQIKAGEAANLPVVVKTDVQGSLEAIMAALNKLSTSEVKVQILHGAVGGITESDVTLTGASGGVILGFNVRANPQARDLARRDGVDIRYYSIIYDLVDDAKKLLGGMLAPEMREQFLGYAEIREVFSITRVGKVAGCMVTDGEVHRGSKVRLLRDNVVIHEGSLRQLKRFKEDVREVRQGFECGMAFENYDDIRVGDVIECFNVQEIARQL